MPYIFPLFNKYVISIFFFSSVTNICLNCITFINLTFRMLQHTSSEVIIIQLKINLNSKIQLYGLGTNEID